MSDPTSLTTEQQFKLQVLRNEAERASREKLIELLLGYAQLLMRRDNFLKANLGKPFVEKMQEDSQ